MIGIIPSGIVIVFVVIRGRSSAFVANRFITDTIFWYKNRGIIAENHFQKWILVKRIMYYVQRFQIANLQLELDVI